MDDWRTNARQLRDELDLAFEAIGKKLGVTLSIGSITFHPATKIFTTKLSASLPTKVGGPVEPTEAKEFKAHCREWGLQPDDLGKTFGFQGQQYTIVGAKPRSYRFPILGQSPSGKKYKFEAEPIVRQLHGNQSKTKRPEAEIIKELQRIEAMLSPENLTADGELPRSVVNRRFRELSNDRQRLVAELGRQPTDQELYGLAKVS